MSLHSNLKIRVAIRLLPRPQAGEGWGEGTCMAIVGGGAHAR